MNPTLDIAALLDNAIPQAVVRAENAPQLAQMPTRGEQVVFEVTEADAQPSGAIGERYTTCSAVEVNRALTVTVRVAGNGDSVRKAHAASGRLMPLFVDALRQSSEWGLYKMIRITDPWSAPISTVGEDGITPTGWLVELPVSVIYDI